MRLFTKLVYTVHVMSDTLTFSRIHSVHSSSCHVPARPCARYRRPDGQGPAQEAISRFAHAHILCSCILCIRDSIVQNNTSERTELKLAESADGTLGDPS